jgi:putative phage-type endonuclease
MEEFQPIMDLLQTTLDVKDWNTNDNEERDTNDNEERDTNDNEENEIDLSMDEYSDIENTVLELMSEYINMESIQYAHPDFHENMIRDIVDILYTDYNDLGIFSDDNEIKTIVKTTSRIFFEINDFPPRSRFYELVDPLFEKWENHEKNLTINHATPGKHQVERLKLKFQPKQRSNEWYEYRYNLITASSIWKIFNSDAQKNSLVYEKCQPLDMQNTRYISQNTENSLHWGVKYEPLSIMIYKTKNQTQVGDFGCIQHEKYPFLGASPDGINIDENSPKFGTMIEVKNIVNRTITGIPSEAYWIQMQIQMETCDLPDCDFIETRFKEYENETDFYADSLHEFKGVILYFMKKNQNDFHYEYMPLDFEISPSKINIWIKEKQSDLKNECRLYQIIYWYMDQYSCVLVERNRFWFESAIPKIESFWKIIENERVTGYEHRAPKKREILFDAGSFRNICVIKLENENEKKTI